MPTFSIAHLHDCLLKKLKHFDHILITWEWFIVLLLTGINNKEKAIFIWHVIKKKADNNVMNSNRLLANSRLVLWLSLHCYFSFVCAYMISTLWLMCLILLKIFLHTSFQWLYILVWFNKKIWNFILCM